jgi:hypothetical protein
MASRLPSSQCLLMVVSICDSRHTYSIVLHMALLDEWSYMSTESGMMTHPPARR